MHLFGCYSLLLGIICFQVCFYLPSGTSPGAFIINKIGKSRKYSIKQSMFILLFNKLCFITNCDCWQCGQTLLWITSLFEVTHTHTMYIPVTIHIIIAMADWKVRCSCDGGCQGRARGAGRTELRAGTGLTQIKGEANEGECWQLRHP